MMYSGLQSISKKAHVELLSLEKNTLPQLKKRRGDKEMALVYAQKIGKTHNPIPDVLWLKIADLYKKTP